MLCTEILGGRFTLSVFIQVCGWHPSVLNELFLHWATAEAVALLEMWESIKKLWMCFTVLVSSSFMATTANSNTEVTTTTRPLSEYELRNTKNVTSAGSSHHNPSHEADSSTAVNVWHHVSLHNGQKGNGDNPQSFHIIASHNCYLRGVVWEHF